MNPIIDLPSAYFEQRSIFSHILTNFCQEIAMMPVDPIARDVALFVLLSVFCSKGVRLFFT